MIKKKEKPEAIHPIRENVKVRVIVPEEMVTKSGVIIPPESRDKVFKKITYYEVQVLEISPEIPAEKLQGLQVGDFALADVFAGNAIPTTGDSYIKLIPYNMLFAKKKNQNQPLKPDQMIAMHERILVKVESKEQKTESGIILPEGDGSSIYDTLVRVGEVLDVSQDVVEIKTGENVCFEDHVGIPIVSKDPKDEAEYRMLVKYDVFAKVDR